MVTVVTTWTGAKAKALRFALRLTVDELADRLGGSPRGIAKWDSRPDHPPGLASQRDLDVLLRNATAEEQARFVLLMKEMEQPAARVAQPSDDVAQLWPTVDSRPPIVPTSETLQWLEQNLQNQYTADNLLGPRALMPTMKSYVSTIEQMQRSSNGAVLDRLLRVGAGYAEFTGWLHHDAGDLQGAARWVSRALEWAQGSMDDRMVSFALMRRAAAALTAREGAYAVRFAQAAQRFESPETGRIRVIAAVTQAHGHAISGEGGEADRALDTAAELLEKYDGEIIAGDPTADRYCALDLYAKIARAKCSLELGRADESVQAFTDVITSLPTDFRRDRGQYLGSLARAHIMAEDPEAACAAGEEALAIAVATGSTRTIADLRRTLPSGLAGWLHVPEVERFCAMLTAADPTNGGN